MKVMEAEVVDASHLTLSSPLSIRPGTRVVVTLVSEADDDAERHAWLDRSAASLARAYSDEEPEYNLPDRA